MPRHHRNHLEPGEEWDFSFAPADPRFPDNIEVPWETRGEHHFHTKWDYKVKRSGSGWARGWERFNWWVEYECDYDTQQLIIHKFENIQGTVYRLTQGSGEVRYDFRLDASHYVNNRPVISTTLVFGVRAVYSESKSFSMGVKFDVGGGDKNFKLGLGGSFGWAYGISGTHEIEGSANITISCGLTYPW